MITFKINNDLADKVRQVKQDGQILRVDKGFQQWINYVNKEAKKLYFDNLSR